MDHLTQKRQKKGISDCPGQLVEQDLLVDAAVEVLYIRFEDITIGTELLLDLTDRGLEASVSFQVHAAWVQGEFLIQPEAQTFDDQRILR